MSLSSCGTINVRMRAVTNNYCRYITTWYDIVDKFIRALCNYFRLNFAIISNPTLNTSYTHMQQMFDDPKSP